jgi:peptidoglycan hydrolase CwlO-like protein
MTGEEMERAIEFLLKSQAQLTANVGKLSDTVDRLSTKVDRTADSVTALLAIAEIHEREITTTDEKLNALIAVVERLAERRDSV